MPLIKRRPKEALKAFTVRIPESLSKRLEAYAEFTNVPLAEIVAEGIRYAIDSDKEFSTESIPSASFDAPETHQKRTAFDSKNKAVTA